jgi:uncharacterized protein (TIGR03067 family)
VALESMVGRGEYWRMLRREKWEGKKLLDELGDLRVTFAGDRVAFRYLRDGKTTENQAPFTLDQTKSPRRLDLPEQPEIRPLPCIYRLEGDELVLCFAFELFKPPARPRDFTVADDSPNWVLTFRRERP